MPRNIRRAALLAAAFTLATAPLAVARPAPPSLVLDQNFPDPDVLSTEDGYYAFATNTPGRNVQAARANDLHGPWEHLPEALPHLPGWIGTGPNGSLNIWAPDVSALDDGRFLMYYTAFHAQSRRQCLGAAVADAPAGPFTPTGPDPLICARAQGDVIDPASFVDDDGRRYLLYKDSRGGHARRSQSSVWLREVAADGLTPLGPDVRLLRADRPEEAGVVEAPTMVRRSGGYVLFYSGNTFDSGRYFVGHATARSITGPFTKAPGALVDKDILGGAVVDPGGQDVPGGEDHLVFHADLADPGGPRGLYVADLTWNGLTPELDL